MTSERCYGFLCFVPLDASGAKLFGFSEFLAALALMVLAWTIADVRYRFRVRTAPLPLQEATFVVIGAVGILTLLTDLWRAERWLVPRGTLLTPPVWQALLGGLFLLTFLTWVWFAFIRPAVFSRWNGRRFARQLYRAILRGSPAELPEIADELARSAKALIEHSWQSRNLKAHYESRASDQNVVSERWLRVRRYAYDTLQLVADRKFCRHIVATSPITALALFEEMASSRKYDVPLDTFAKNITSEAIANKDSFVYHEVAGYHTGYIGQHRPLTQALYGNYELVEALEQVFDVDYRERDRWDAEQWGAFCRLVLTTLGSAVKEDSSYENSSVLHRFIGDIEQSIMGLLRKVDGTTADWWVPDSIRRLNVVVTFALDAIKVLDKKPSPLYATLRHKPGHCTRDIYDSLAGLMFEVIFEASAIKGPPDLCWSVQHNSVWTKFFGIFSSDGPAGRVVKFKLRRLIYDEVARMTEWPNFKGARVLGMALNVMGLRQCGTDLEKDTEALRKAVLSWTKKHYARVAAESPRVANDCLVEGMTYENEGPRLIKTGMQILDRDPSRTILELDPALATRQPA